MIDEDRTMQLFGYTSEDLPPSSSKPVIAVCEECGKYRVTTKPAYRVMCLSCGHTSTHNGMYGKNHTSRSKEKMSTSSTGITHSKTSHEKMSRSRSGSDNANWKGGATIWRRLMYSLPSYKNWRKAVFERDDYTCQMCNDATGGNLQAHHIHPVRDHKNDLLVFDVNNGITLCRKCHESIGGHEYRFITVFKAIIGGV